MDDVTELELAEQQLRQSQKMEAIGMLAGGVAHDFNNILLGITATVSLIKLTLASGRAVDVRELGDQMDMMEKSAGRAKDLVTRLLTIVRKQVLALVPSDLVEIVKEVIAVCANSFDRRVDITTSFKVARAPLKADPVQLEQVFLNIAINALHAMTIMRGEGQPQGGVLSIAIARARADKGFILAHPGAQEGRDYWAVQMSDTGVGIPQENLARIFDPFFTTKPVGGGSGLGLTMVYNIVHQHDGFLSFSSHPDAGTTLTVYLPMFEGGTPPAEDAARDKPEHGEGTVMVVDDEEMVRRLAGEMLTRCGYAVEFASNGMEAIELLERNRGRIKVILLDMNMSQLSGYDAFDRLHAIDPRAAILVTSGFIRDERVEGLIQRGAKDFIQKPYTIQSLSHAVSRAISSHG